MRTWRATRKELSEDFDRMVDANYKYIAASGEVSGCDLTRYCDATHPADGGPVTYRIAFHDYTQDAVRIVTPSPKYLWALMTGGFVRHKRVIADCPKTGLPIFEGTNDLLPPMTEREAVEYLAWRDVPKGCNNVQIITTKDLPSTRVFRDAWVLKEAA